MDVYMKFLLVLILMAAGRVMAWRGLNNFTRLKFGREELFASDLWLVYHMELDQYKNDGSILIAAGSHIKTTNGTHTTLIASDLGGTGFAQVNSTHVVIACYFSHCLRILDRRDNSVRVLAGVCGSNGSSAGVPGKFHSPHSVVVDINDPGRLIVTDKYNHGVRTVDLQTGNVSSVLGPGFYPESMAWYGDSLLVINHHYIGKIQVSASNRVTGRKLTGFRQNYRSIDGPFEIASFRAPKSIYKLYDNIYLVGDEDRFRLLDMNRQLVLRVCIRKKCTLAEAPYSMLRTNEAFYYGTYRTIQKVTGGRLFNLIQAASNPPETENRNLL